MHVLLRSNSIQQLFVPRDVERPEKSAKNSRRPSKTLSCTVINHSRRAALSEAATPARRKGARKGVRVTPFCPAAAPVQAQAYGLAFHRRPWIASPILAGEK